MRGSVATYVVCLTTVFIAKRTPSKRIQLFAYLPSLHKVGCSAWWSILARQGWFADCKIQNTPRFELHVNLCLWIHLEIREPSSCVQKTQYNTRRIFEKPGPFNAGNARNAAMIQSLNFSLPCQTETPTSPVTRLHRSNGWSISRAGESSAISV